MYKSPVFEGFPEANNLGDDERTGAARRWQILSL